MSMALGERLGEGEAAAPLDGDGSIPPGATVRFGARIDDLTPQELDEALSDVVIYVYEPHRCPG